MVEISAQPSVVLPNETHFGFHVIKLLIQIFGLSVKYLVSQLVGGEIISKWDDVKFEDGESVTVKSKTLL